jgi:ribonuclease-3
MRSGGKDAKTRLQEVLQSRRQGLPRYAVTGVHGAAHQQVFEVECTVDGLALAAQGSGSSRRAAEQVAAEAMLRQLEA